MTKSTPTGRPPKYKTPEEMQAKIDEYFKSCEGVQMTDKNGNPMFNKFGEPIFLGRKPITVTGLALALGFNSRQALLNYQAKPLFNDTITRAKARVEEYTESRLYDKDGVTGAKFSLANNFGWKNKDSENSENDGVTIIDDIH